MRLSQLLPEHRDQIRTHDPDITGLTEDSRRIQPGSLFVAVPGTALDGHAFIDDAVARGAAALVIEQRNESGALRDSSTALTIRVPSSRTALARIAARFFGDPARELRLVGFTGTFGKTTTSEVVRTLLETAGRKVGVLGSLGARYGSFQESRTGLTNPAPVELHSLLRKLRDAGADTVIMEITTHGLLLGRVEGLRFGDGLLAAVMPGEHTDFHRTYDDYVAAKRRFVDFLDAEALLAYDADNRAASTIAAAAHVRATAGMSTRRPPGSPHDLTLKDVVLDSEGALFTVRGTRLRSSLLGRHNVRNAGLALAFALGGELGLGAAEKALKALRPPHRRMERFRISGRTVVDDTAAHPDSFKAAFEVADLLPHERLLAAYAIRGNRGEEINRRNALALADLTAVHALRSLVLTAAADVAGPADRASAAEIDSTRDALQQRGQKCVWHDTLAGAIGEVAARSGRGDLILLIGAQGMDEGARLLREELDRTED